MTRRRRTFALLVLPLGLLIYATPGEAWDLRTHWALTDQAVNNALNKSTGLAAYLGDVGIQSTDKFNPTARTTPEFLAEFENTGTPHDWMIEGAIRANAA